MAKLEQAQQDNPSMEEILQTIRGVIAGEVTENEDAEDILELTEIAEEPAPAKNESPKPVQEANEASKDILENIDKILEEENAAIPEPMPAPEPVVEVTPVPVAEEPAPEPQPQHIIQAEEPIITIQPEEPIHIEEPVIEAVAVEAVKELEHEVTSAKMETIQEVEEKPMSSIASVIDVVHEVESPAPVQQSPAKGLLSEQVAAQSMRALKELVGTVPKHGPCLRSGVTIEDLVIEALRPQLSDWLDKHLADLVERLVEKEIRKLVPEDRE